MPCILTLLQKFLGHNVYERELCLPHKYHSRLVLFFVPSSIARLCKVIQFLYGFGYGKSETQHWDVSKIGIAMG